MSLLCVTVRRAALVGNGQFNTYVILKLQNVKSTTVTVKGNNPSWEQDFIFETNRMDIGLIIEVWNKGMLWDKFLGTQWMPLTRVKYANEPEEGQWLSLDQELVIEEGEVVGTKVPTGHSLLLEAHFEVGCDELEDAELMKKIELLNVLLGQEISTVKEQERRHNLVTYSGVSEDSDYTSDVSYPTVQHPSASVHHPNSSASQYGGAAEISRRASEYSPHRDVGHRDARYIEPGNSYDADHHYNGPVRENSDYDRNYSTEDPLYYNSRPNVRMNSRSTDRSRSTRSTSGYNNSLSLESDMRYSFETDRTDRSSRHCHWSEDTIDSEADKVNLERFQRSDRRRSLERQTGFDESIHDFIEHHNQSNQSSYDYHDSTEYPQSSFDSYQDYREDSVSTDWEKGSRYTPSQDYVEQDPYYNEWAENEVPHHKQSGSKKYVHDQERTDWSKVNGTVGGRTVRHKPDPDKWRTDSTGSVEWKKSVESDWSKDSPKNEWDQDVPIMKEPPYHGRNNWNQENITKTERTPAIDTTKSSNRWTDHPPEFPPKDVDRRNSKQPVVDSVKPADHWNNQRVEPPARILPTTDRLGPSKNQRTNHAPEVNDQWNDHPKETVVKNGERWNDHPKETVVKNGERWNDHPKETVKNVDRWNDHPKEPVTTADQWNDQRKESLKSGEQWNGRQRKDSLKTAEEWNDHAKEIAKIGERWNDHTNETSKVNDRWNGHTSETSKVNDRWNGHTSETSKVNDRWNGHEKEPVKSNERWNDDDDVPPEPAKSNHSWNGPNETVQEEDEFMFNTSSMDTVKNAETWKTHEPMKNGWSDETITQEWDEDQMTENQLDNLISDWQDENEQNDWLPEEDRFKDDVSKPEFPDEYNKRDDYNKSEYEIKPVEKLEPPAPQNNHKPQSRNSIDHSGNLTLTINEINTDVSRDRRPSVMSITKNTVVPSLETSNIMSELLIPRTEAPELIIDDSDPNMSRAKRRWINAFNKIVAQLNEVDREPTAQTITSSSSQMKF